MDDSTLAATTFDAQFAKLKLAGALFGVRFTAEEEKAFKQQAVTAIEQLESADIALQEKGEAAMATLKKSVLSKILEIPAIKGQFDREQVETVVNSHYDNALEDRAAALAGARVINAIASLQQPSLPNDKKELAKRTALETMVPQQRYAEALNEIALRLRRQGIKPAQDATITSHQQSLLLAAEAAAHADINKDKIVSQQEYQAALVQVMDIISPHTPKQIGSSTASSAIR